MEGNGVEILVYFDIILIYFIEVFWDYIGLAGDYINLIWVYKILENKQKNN